MMNMSNGNTTCSTEALAKSGFAVVMTPLKRGSDGKVTLRGAKALLNGECLEGNAIEAGRIQWLPKEALRFKAAKYKAMDRLIGELGVSWGSGKLVPLGRLEELKKRFEELKDQFFKEVDTMEFGFDSMIDDYATQQPPAVAAVIQSVRMDWQAFRSSFVIELPTPSVFAPISGDLGSVRDQVVDATQLDIIEQAEELLEKILGKDKVDPRSIPPIKRLVEKTRNFGILNAGFRRLAEAFDDFERELIPPIDGGKRERLEKYLLMLSSPSAVEAFIKNGNEEDNTENLGDIFGFGGSASPALPTPTMTTQATSPDDAWSDWESVSL